MTAKYNSWLLAGTALTLVTIIGAIILMSAGKPERAAVSLTESQPNPPVETIKQPTNWQCFYFNPALADPSNITQSGNYTATLDTDPCGDPETLCKICFDVAEFPLNDFDQPDFTIEELHDLVQGNALFTVNEGVNIPTETPDSYMRFYFRAE